MNSIRCPHCQKEVELSEAVLAVHVAEATKQAEEKLKKEYSEKQSIELTDLKKQLDEQKEKNEEFRQQELELRKKQRELEEKEKDIEILTARKIDEERKKIEEKVLQDESERRRLKDKEKDEQIDNLKRMLDDAQRKASQASQQTQGEVLEVDLEERLRLEFPNDLIEAVGKGVHGGDIIQHVRNSFGKTAGIILWETKRAAWSPSWLAKLREDTRAAGASMAILVTETLPKDVKNFSYVESVLVTTYAFAIPLAIFNRRTLMQIAAAKTSAANKDEKLEMLYQYLQSDAFRHRFEAYAEGIIEMRNDLDTERRSLQRIWKKREMQIVKTENNIVNLWGELQGIMGSSLPDIKTLSLSPGESEENENL